MSVTKPSHLDRLPPRSRGASAIETVPFGCLFAKVLQEGLQDFVWVKSYLPGIVVAVGAFKI